MTQFVNNLRLSRKVSNTKLFHFIVKKPFPALAFRLGGVVSFSALLVACGSSTPRVSQQVPIAQEVADYKSRARSYYAPPGPASDPWGPYIKEASKRFDVPEQWIRAVMKQESGGSLYHNGQLVTSGPGAMGLMQLMPPTYDEMRMTYNLGDDAYEPHDNIMAGTAYIRQMYDIYGSPGFLAAYNGGPGRLDDFLTRNRTLPLETRRYVASIGPQIDGVNPKRRSQADLLVDSHRSGMAVDPSEYASAAQPMSSRDRRLKASPQAASVSQAWASRAAGGSADQLNSQSLNGVSPAVTDTLNSQSLRAGGVAMASASQSASRYPAKWKNFDKQPTAVASNTAGTNSGSVSSVWASRGYQQTRQRPVAVQSTNTSEPPIIIRQAAPVEVASAPVSNSYRKKYYQPVSYQLTPSTSKTTKHAITTTSKVSSSGSWGIQVGAFNSASQASSAAGKAKNRASLSAGTQQVQSVTVGKNKLYRARVTGLSQSAAKTACQKLDHCMLLSPSKI